MKLVQALIKLQQGFAIRRACWDDAFRWVMIDGEIFERDGRSVEIVPLDCFTLDDVNANDWELW